MSDMTDDLDWGDFDEDEMNKITCKYCGKRGLYWYFSTTKNGWELHDTGAEVHLCRTKKRFRSAQEELARTPPQGQGEKRT